MNKCCANCRFWTRHETAGTCSAPVPDSVRFTFGRKRMSAIDGVDCGGYRKRIERQKKAQAAA